jgi:mannose-6-phosphate isomerase-like protein (cupin superfamily)
MKVQSCCLFCSNTNFNPKTNVSFGANLTSINSAKIVPAKYISNFNKILWQIKKFIKELPNLVRKQKTYYRPWGSYTNLAEEKGVFLTKKIYVNPKQQLSVQSHNHRSEHWLVVSGNPKVILNDKELMLKPGDNIDIPVKAKHSLQNPSKEPVEVIEVQLGDDLREDDIIRYSDIYGRANT